jgi:hypothetical protein
MTLVKSLHNVKNFPDFFINVPGEKDESPGKDDCQRSQCVDETLREVHVLAQRNGNT